MTLESPHDGKKITFPVLSHALQAGYGISPMFADFLVLGSYILLRRSVLKPLDLHEIDEHNRIEHNASVVHDDADGSKLAPEHVDPSLLHKFLNKAYSSPRSRSAEGNDVITIEDIARTRIAREAACSAPPDALHAEIARGEFAMVLNIFGEGPAKTLNTKDLEVWLNENRFPDHWTPTHQEKLMDTIAENKKMRDLMEAYRGEEPHHIFTTIGKMLSDESNEGKRLFTAFGKTMEHLLENFKTTGSSHDDGASSEVQAEGQQMTKL